MTKLSSNGALVYSTYLGAGFEDIGYGIAVDGGGNAYVTGFTLSGDFPLLNAYDNSYNGGSGDAFVTKLSSNGALVYSTYLGGSGLDNGRGIAADGSGNAYVTGFTLSGDFPLLNAFDSSLNGQSDAFVTKLLVGPILTVSPVGLSLGPVFGEPGETVSVPMTLSNTNTICVGGIEWQVIRGSNAMQFDSFVTSVPGFTANANTVGDTTFVLFHSPNDSVIPPGTVFLGSLRYLIDAEAPLCTTIPLNIQGLVIGDSLANALPDSSVNGEIQAGIPGDLNLDRRVSVLDVIKLVRVLVGKDTEPDSISCQFFIADFNTDDALDILDVIGQVNTILHVTKQIAAPVPTTAVIRFGYAQASSSGGLVVPVELQSDGLIAGLQATVRSDPSVVTVGTPQLAGSASALSLDASVKDGTLRFVLFATQPGQGIAAGNSTVLLIPITLRNGVTELPSFELSDVVVASAQAQRVPVTIGTPVKAAALPTAFSLSANRPNPFNPSTQIAYEVPQQAHITLAVYNLLGQEVVRLVNTVHQAGRYTVTWNAHNAQGQAVSSGVYLYRLTSSTGFVESRRMVLLK